METWDKLYINLKDLLQYKNSSAQLLWTLAHTYNKPSLKTKLLQIWKTEVLHSILLNKLLRNLGYTQIKPTNKHLVELNDFSLEINKIIMEKEKWRNILEKISLENFGNEVYFTLEEITVEDIVNLEILQELQKLAEEYYSK